MARPKSNLKSTGFLPHEREFLTEMVDAGFHDAFRVLYPEKADEYTWWTYRGGCREKNIGWRLDYFFIDDKIKELNLKYLPPVKIDYIPMAIVGRPNV